jgi:hypothetical protein
MVPWHPHGHDPRTKPWARRKIVVLAVDPKTLSGFPLSVLRPTNWHLFNFGNQMRIRTIAAALVVAAPLLALESPSAAACWEGSGYGYGAAGYAAPRYGYMSYGYSSPAYYGGFGVGRVAARRAVWRGGGYYGGVRRVGYRGGIGVGRVGVGRVGVAGLGDVR